MGSRIHMTIISTPFHSRVSVTLGVSAFMFVLLLLAGCATAPVQQVRLFNTAFADFNGASQPLFDDLAIAERRQGKEVAEAKARRNSYQGDCAGIGWMTVGFIDGFCVDDAYYFSEIGDPPATRRFREGIGVIGQYAEVLLVLAEGRNLDETSAQVQSLGANIAALVSMSSGPGAGAAFTGALAALDPIIRDAAQQKNVEEVKRLVLAGSPHVKKLIGSLRDGAPEVFNTLIFQSVKGTTDPESLTNKVVAKSHLDRIAAYRAAVSNYVVLLAELDHTFDELVVAVQRPRNTVSLALVTDRSNRLAAHADAWRRVYSALRAGGA
jgi:hypothetical protein